jgi:hypothetical protein
MWQQIELTEIRIDGDTQSREKIDHDAVADYRRAYEAGVNLPPLLVVQDGKTYYLSDGFTRFYRLSPTILPHHRQLELSGARPRLS